VVGVECDLDGGEVGGRGPVANGQQALRLGTTANNTTPTGKGSGSGLVTPSQAGRQARGTDFPAPYQTREAPVRPSQAGGMMTLPTQGDRVRHSHACWDPPRISERVRRDPPLPFGHQRHKGRIVLPQHITSRHPNQLKLGSQVVVMPQ
jgi:hypothetical protein